jgi:hypothetical protein
MMRLFYYIFLIIVVTASGCSAFGPGRIKGDRFNYGKAINISEKEQMLTNLVRLRFGDVPMFVDVSSVVTNYTYTGGLGATGTKIVPNPFGETLDSVTGSANLEYTETPTISYTPVSGEDFATRLLQPLPIGYLFSIAQSGWPVELLLLIGIERINDMENMSAGFEGARTRLSGQGKAKNEIGKYLRFKDLVDLMLELMRRRVMEFTRNEKDGSINLIIAPYLPPDAIDLLNTFRTRLNLDSDTIEYRVVGRTTKRHNDEISIQTRSLLGMMNFLTKGIEIPNTLSEISDGGATPELPSRQVPLPLHIAAGKGKPKNAFAAIRYERNWFYIAKADIQSKQVFSLLRYLFQLQTPPSEGTAPVLTLPASR